MLKLKIKCLILFLMWAFVTFGQSKHFNKNGPKLYLCMGDLGPVVDSFMKANDIHEVKSVNGSKIDPGDIMIINAEVLKAEIERLYPDPSTKGMCILDWEGKAINLMYKTLPDDPKYVNGLKKCIQAVKIAKELRPNVKWSIYGMPFRNYWDMDSAWQKRCLGLVPLLKECDFIAPSIYNPYPDSVSKEHEKMYVHGNIQMALKIGSIVNRPVCPLIWHRLPNFDLIPKNEFLNHIKNILDESYNGVKIDALIWFGSDIYGYNVKINKFLSEIGERSNLTPYVNHLVINYASGILPLLKR